MGDRSMLSGLPDDMAPAVPLDRCFDACYGLEIIDDQVLEKGCITGRVTVAERTLGPTGIVHGGIYASIAEALAARATIKALVGRRAAVGMSNDTRFLRPVEQGSIRSVALIRSRSDDVWLWEVEHRDDRGRLCALTRMTIAVR